MATVALRRPALLGRSIAGTRAGDAAGVGALVAFSLLLRTGHMGVPFWIDEGLSVGIASHHLTAIPGLLRLDGSPPLYYLVLHVWMSAFGRSEVDTHALSLLCALLSIPAAWWAGRSLFGPHVGWLLAGLTALNPFLTAYAQETRMYALVILLTTLCTACFLHAYLFRRRRYLVPFGVLLAALLYTHNWGFFYAAGLFVAAVLIARAGEDRRPVLRDAVLGFGLAALLYLPWVPTFISQARHTGAPWALRPPPKLLLRTPDLLLGGQTGTIALLFGAGAGLVALRARSTGERRVLLPALVAMAASPVVIAWVVSQASPAWATRYLAIAVAPLLLLVALGLERGGRIAAVALAIVAVSWTFHGAPDAKSNARYIANTFRDQLGRGDVVLSTQPEQVPVLAYYLRPDVTYANPFGVVHDTGVVDWRDGVQHFDRTGVTTQLLPLLAHIGVGHRLLLVEPIFFDPERWGAAWTSRVMARSTEYDGVVRGDRRFTLIGTVPTGYRIPGPNPLLGLLFEKTAPN